MHLIKKIKKGNLAFAAFPLYITQHSLPRRGAAMETKGWNNAKE